MWARDPKTGVLTHIKDQDLSQHLGDPQRKTPWRIPGGKWLVWGFIGFLLGSVLFALVLALITAR